MHSFFYNALAIIETLSREKGKRKEENQIFIAFISSKTTVDDYNIQKDEHIL